jgi:hypothetical protein
VAGLLLALLGVAVLVVAVIALQHPHGRSAQAGKPTSTPSSHASRTAAPSTSAPASGTSGSPSGSASSAAGNKLPLVVLNNTTVSGLAQQAAARFEAGGWTVTSYTNYTNNILSTCAYYDPAVPGAKEAATALQAQFPAIKRIQPQFAELSSYHSPIVVILTPDYS